MKHHSGSIAEPWDTQIRALEGGELPAGSGVALARYVEWLRTEAVPAGAIGPDEMARVWPRHIIDSLTYASVLPDMSGRAVDVGSGAGLPGIPLAIVRPGLEVTLLDRSGRRCRLLRRAVRVLGLTNVAVLEEDVDAIDGLFEVMVFRASLPPDQAFPRVGRLLATSGVAVIGLSRRAAPAAETLRSEAAGYELEAEIEVVGADVLDSPAWLLRMSRRDYLF